MLYIFQNVFLHQIYLIWQMKSCRLTSLFSILSLKSSPPKCKVKMSTTSRPYTVTPLYVRNGEVQFGCQIDGIELSKNVSNEVVKQIKDDVRDHRVVVFKNQGILLPERHLEIAKWFGELESTFYNHPKSPDRDIFRVSNDKNEGWDGTKKYKNITHII